MHIYPHDMYVYLCTHYIRCFCARTRFSPYWFTWSPTVLYLHICYGSISVSFLQRRLAPILNSTQQWSVCGYRRELSKLNDICKRV